MSERVLLATAILLLALMLAALPWLFATMRGWRAFGRVMWNLDDQTRKELERAVTRGRPARTELAGMAAEIARRQKPLMVLTLLECLVLLVLLSTWLTSGQENLVIGAIMFGLVMLGGAIFSAVMIWTSARAQRINAEIAARTGQPDRNQSPD